MAPQLVGGRRAAGARVQEARARRRAVPGRAGPAGAREPVERRELGGAGRPRQNQLVPPRRSISRVDGGYAATACVVTTTGGGGGSSCSTNASSPPATPARG
jgi:hypothetical protein